MSWAQYLHRRPVSASQAALQRAMKNGYGAAVLGQKQDVPRTHERRLQAACGRTSRPIPYRVRPIVDIAIDQLVARYRSATCFRIQAMNARFREAQPACGTPATDQKRPPRRLRQFADKFLKAPTRWVVVIRKKLGQFFSLRTYSKISGICQQAKGKT